METWIVSALPALKTGLRPALRGWKRPETLNGAATILGRSPTRLEGMETFLLRDDLRFVHFVSDPP